MKYRITRATKRHAPAPQDRIFRLCALQTLSRMAYHHEETIDFAKLFEISGLPTLYREKKTHSLFAAIFTFFLAAFARISGLFRRSVARLRKKAARFAARRRARKEKRQKSKRESAYWLAGAACGSLAVTLICAVSVIMILMHPYGGVYRVATVPSLVGTRYEETLVDDDRFSFVVEYQYNPDVEPGVVISQSPSAGVTRRIYRRGNPCTVTLTVCMAIPRYTLPSLVGQAGRDAVLVLRNHGVACDIVSSYSDTAPIGTVIGQSLPQGTSLSAGDAVALTVSIGPRIIVCTVPSLVGLSEMQASSLLSSAGLALGEVTYVPSDRPSGTVLSQSESPTSLLEQGKSVSLTVSAGYSYAQKGVPSLYGLTLGEAAARLREYGLVLGTVTTVGNPAQNAKVVAQSPLPDTPITSSTVSVDIYLGS